MKASALSNRLRVPSFRPRIADIIDLDIAPLFADDGMIGGDTEVLRALRHMKQVMPLVGLRFSHL